MKIALWGLFVVVMGLNGFDGWKEIESTTIKRHYIVKDSESKRHVIIIDEVESTTLNLDESTTVTWYSECAGEYEINLNIEQKNGGASRK